MNNSPVRDLLRACEDFEVHLKTFIKTTRDKNVAPEAAQCLFAVHRLEGVLDGVASARRSRHVDSASVPVKIIPAIEKEDL